MKIYRNNVGIEMTLDEFINLLEDEDRVYDVTELIATLEEDEFLREEEARLALQDDEASDDEDVHPYDSVGSVAVLDPPAINQYFINVHSQDAYPEGVTPPGMDYLDELKELDSDELAKVQRIIQRFGSLLS